MPETHDHQIDLPLAPNERKETAQMDPLQQQVVKLFNRFQDLNWGFREKATGNTSQGKAMDWRAQKQIDTLFLKEEFLRKISDDPTQRPHPTPDVDDILNNRAIRNRLQWFIQVMEAKLAQMEGNERFSARKYPHEKAWRESPRHILKTIQEILCDPTDRIIFSREELNEEHGLNAAADTIIISPERINDTLLENLGLHEFSCRPTKEKKRFTTAERLERTTAAIPEIRRMIQNLEFIRRPDERKSPVGDLKYFRMMRIGEGTDPEPNTSAGYILGTQINNGTRILFRTELHGADRRLIHIDRGYHEEQEKLHTVLETLNSIERNKTEWSGPHNAKKREELHTALREIIDSMEHVKNYHKKRLRQNLKNYLELMGNSNPGAAGWNLERARVNIGKRSNDMENISGNLKRDAQKVHGLILQEEQPYATFIRDVESIKDDFTTLTPEQLRPRLTSLQAHIIATMQFEPYRSIGQQCVSAIESTLAHLTNGKPEEAHNAFMRLYFITKLERAHYKLAKTNRDLVERGEDQADPRAVLERLTRIYNELCTHALAPEERHDQLRGPYIEFYKTLQEMRFTLGDLLGVTQPDIDIYRPQPAQAEINPTPAPTPEPEPSPNKNWRKKLSAILEKQTARIKNFLQKAIDQARKVMGARPVQPDLSFRPTRDFTPKESYDTLVKIRRSMSEFDFTSFIQKI